MRMNTIALLFFCCRAAVVEAADVRMQRLEDFDLAAHALSVSVGQELTSDCYFDHVQVTKLFEGLLTGVGFTVVDISESQLEFAVMLRGLQFGPKDTCGLKLSVMVRQVPHMKVLRLSPADSSNRFRLWTSENLLTGSRQELWRLLQEQATQDVIAFHGAVVMATK